MKKPFLLFFAMIFSFTAFSQINFEKGHIVRNGQKIECLIKNEDWRNNPVEFQYKLSEGAEIETASIKTVEEFEVYGESKYVRVKVEIDRSGDQLLTMSRTMAPEFNEEQLFLQVLVEGKANLYEYVDGRLKRYFYKIDESEVKQLIYKEYKTDENSIAKNIRFKQQLWNNLKCPDISRDKIEKIDYTKKDLKKYFVFYNECADSEYMLYEKKEKTIFHLSLRPGISISSVDLTRTSSGENTDYGSNLGYRFGVEAEFVFPFNKNKWAVFVEPTFQSYSSEKTLDSDKTTTRNEDYILSVDYKSIELPMGIRHYMFLGQKSKLFVNAAFILDFALDSNMGRRLITGGALNPLEIKSRPNFAIGAGFNYDNKYSVEVRYGFTRDILSDYVGYKANYNSVSLILGYMIF